MSIAVLLCSVYASVFDRGLFNDGAYFLYKVAERNGFYLVDTPRMTVHIMRQAPVVFLSNFTDWSLLTRGSIFSLAMFLWPLTLCLTCWLILPPDDKAWMVFPLLNVLAGNAAMWFYPVGEAAIAAAYFWVLLFLLLFRCTRVPGQLCFLFLCLPAFCLHEGGFPLTLLLLLTCILLFRHRAEVSPRVFESVAIALCLAILIYQLLWVLYPRLPVQRAAVLHLMAHGDFLFRDGRVNLPLATGALALLAFAGVSLAHAVRPIQVASRVSRTVALTFAAVAIGASIAALAVDQTFAPDSQAAARYQPVFVSFLLGAAVLVAARYAVPQSCWMTSYTLVIVLGLCVAQGAADLAGTNRWREYTIDLRSRLLSSSGLIPWQLASSTGDQRRDKNWQLMSKEWVVPLMSIIFAKGGVVTAIIDLSPETTARVIEPERPDWLPKLRGVDFSPFQRSFSPKQVVPPL